MQSTHFDVQGFSRTYWDLFAAGGFSTGVFLFFASVLAWQLARLQPETLALMRGTAWALAACFVAISIVSWRYLFTVPLVLAVVVTACLVAAAWRSSTQVSPTP